MELIDDLWDYGSMFGLKNEARSIYGSFTETLKIIHIKLYDEK